MTFPLSHIELFGFFNLYRIVIKAGYLASLWFCIIPFYPKILHTDDIVVFDDVC